MSNSPLVNFTKISPNRTSPRNHVIDTITIHCVVGQCTVETLGEVFAKTSRQASSNYGVGKDGRIGMYVEEKDRSWCTSNRDNDNRAITIEVASDTTHPYAVTDAAYEGLIKLLVDICQRNNIKQLLWKADKSLIGQPDKQNMTVHRWFANKSCPGDYLYERHDEIAAEVNRRLGAASKEDKEPESKPVESKKLYRVQVGAYDDKVIAEAKLEKVKAAGFADAFIVVSETEDDEEVVETTKPIATFAVGDKVKLVKGAKYYDGRDIPSWVFAKNLYVRRIYTNNNVVFSTQPIGAVTGVVEPKYLTKI